MTATAVGPACTQPGCTGTIVDGWCDVCGSPGTAAAAPAPAPRSHGRPPPAVAPRPLHPAGLHRDGRRRLLRRLRDPRGDARRRDAARPAAGRGRVDRQARGSSRLPAGLDGPRLLAAHRRSPRGPPAGSAAGRSGCGPPASAPGLTRVPPAPVVDAANAVLVDASVPENKRSCARCGKPVGRGRDGRPGRPEGFCASCGAPYSFTPKLKAGDLVGGPVRRRRRPRARRPRLDLPGARQERLRPLGGAEGPAELGRPRRPGGGDRGAAVPRGGGAPADRRDLQLRARTRVRATSSWSTSAGSRSSRSSRSGCGPTTASSTRCPSTRRWRTSSRCCPPSPTCTTSAWSTATSSPTTSSRSATRSS